jgi:hypothetical protein
VSTDPSICSKIGTCVSQDVCVCPKGYYGRECEYFDCYGIPVDNGRVCSSVGQCVLPDTCQCKPGFVGTECNVALCYGKNSSDPKVCSGKGICSGKDRCICHNTYTGNECEFKNETMVGIVPDCVIFQNNFIRYYKTEKSFVIEPNICSKNGWGGIAFHQKSGVDSSMFVAVSWFENNVLKFGELKDHHSKQLKSYPSIGLLLPQDDVPIQLQFQEKQRFIIEVDEIILKKFDHISIVCSDSPVDSSKEFLYHQVVTTNIFNISSQKSECDSFVLTVEQKSLADTSQWYWFLEMGFYVWIFLMLVIFRDYQPLKSRGFIPFLAILTQYGGALASTQHFFFNLEWRSKNSCIMQTLLRFNFQSTIFCIMPLSYFRYVLLINMNKEKQNISKDGHKTSIYVKMILFFKFLTTPMVSFFILAFFYFLISMIDFLFIAAISPSFSCSSLKSYWFYGLHLVLNVSMGFILLMIGLFDVILNIVKYFNSLKRKTYKRNRCIKLVKDNFVNFYVNEDYYQFRLEQIFAFLVFALYILFEILNFNLLIYGNENLCIITLGNTSFNLLGV